MAPRLPMFFETLGLCLRSGDPNACNWLRGRYSVWFMTTMSSISILLLMSKWALNVPLVKSYKS